MALLPFVTVAREWDSLEPAMNPDYARTDHVVLKPSTTFPQGQVIAQKDDGSNEWGLRGTAGYGTAAGSPRRIMQYPCVTNAQGRAFLGSALPSPSGAETGFDSMPAYYRIYAFTKDLVGIPDDAALAEVGPLVRGTRADGIVHLR
jgi:hypothetical protein